MSLSVTSMFTGTRTTISAHRPLLHRRGRREVRLVHDVGVPRRPLQRAPVPLGRDFEHATVLHGLGLVLPLNEPVEDQVAQFATSQFCETDSCGEGAAGRVFFQGCREAPLEDVVGRPVSFSFRSWKSFTRCSSSSTSSSSARRSSMWCQASRPNPTASQSSMPSTSSAAAFSGSRPLSLRCARSRRPRRGYVKSYGPSASCCAVRPGRYTSSSANASCTRSSALMVIAIGSPTFLSDGHVDVDVAGTDPRHLGLQQRPQALVVAHPPHRVTRTGPPHEPLAPPRVPLRVTERRDHPRVATRRHDRRHASPGLDVHLSGGLTSRRMPGQPWTGTPNGRLAYLAGDLLADLTDDVTYTGDRPTTAYPDPHWLPLRQPARPPAYPVVHPHGQAGA